MSDDYPSGVPLLSVHEALARGGQILPLDGSATLLALHTAGYVVVGATEAYYETWKHTAGRPPE